jgi:hypothetical protein
LIGQVLPLQREDQDRQRFLNVLSIHLIQQSPAMIQLLRRSLKETVQVSRREMFFLHVMLASLAGQIKEDPMIKSN